MNGIRAANHSLQKIAVRIDERHRSYIWYASKGKMLRHDGYTRELSPLFSEVTVEEIDELLRREDWNPMKQLNSIDAWFSGVVHRFSCCFKRYRELHRVLD